MAKKKRKRSVVESGDKLCVACGLNVNEEEIENLLLGEKEGESVTAHHDCLIWIPEVYENNDRFFNVKKALKRIKSIKCKECSKPGASVGCLHKTCRASYHLPCAIQALCSLDSVNFQLFCPSCDPSKTVCGVCNEEGILLCCDGCEYATHLECSNMKEIPLGEWFCSTCTNDNKEEEVAVIIDNMENEEEPLKKRKKRNVYEYKVGDIIEGRYSQGRFWYKGVISYVHENETYNIKYDDGDEENNVIGKHIRSFVDPMSLVPESILPRDNIYTDLDPTSESIVELFCLSDKKWYPANCVSIDGDKIKMHFKGWDSKYDCWVNRSEQYRFAPYGTHTKARKPPKSKEQLALEAKERLIKEREAIAKQLSSSFLLKSDMHTVTTLSKSGRTVQTVVTARNPKYGQGLGRNKDHNEDICAVCGNYDSFEGDPLLCCDGTCLRVFHLSCLGLSEIPPDDKWLCQGCIDGKHACLSCGVMGTDNEDVFLCTGIWCGRYFHEECIRKYPKAVISDRVEGEKVKFRCPVHICEVCDMTASQRVGSKMLACYKCPTAYHSCCVPPSALSNDINLHCPSHAHLPLPFQAGDTCELIESKSEAFPKIPIPKVCPLIEQARNVNHFRLPFNLLTEVECKPPPFKLIRKNNWLVPMPDKVIDKDVSMCDCTDWCGRQCVNFLLNIECDAFNCSVGGGDCGNRSITKRQAVANKPFRTMCAGWALKTLEDLEQGRFVMEYQGEIYDETIYEERMQAYKERGEVNYYVMKFGKDLYIDAAEEGNMSRFMNHSCDPNCVTETWSVNGESRIAFRTLRDIAAGEELTYDYQFISAEKIECHCGALNCKRLLGNDAVEEMKKSEKDKVLLALTSGDQIDIEQVRKQFTLKELNKVKSKAIASRRRQTERQEKDDKENIQRLSLTKSHLPGDNTCEISKGPRGYMKGLYLKRNAHTGNMFLSRYEMMKKKIKSLSNT